MAKKAQKGPRRIFCSASDDHLMAFAPGGGRRCCGLCGATGNLTKPNVAASGSAMTKIGTRSSRMPATVVLETTDVSPSVAVISRRA